MHPNKTPSLGQDIDNHKVVELPLNGRNFITLAGLVPGVALPPNSSLPRINGGRPRTNEYLFDGISVLQPEPGQVAYFPVIDAVQEFKIATNSYDAQYGRTAGGVVNMSLKSGTNTFGGTVAGYFRSDRFNASDFIQNRVVPYQDQQVVATFGGPIRKDRAHFFANYEQERQPQTVTFSSTYPAFNIDLAARNRQRIVSPP